MTEELVKPEDNKEVEDMVKGAVLEELFKNIQPMIEEASKAFGGYLEKDKGGRCILIKHHQGKVYVLDIENSGITQDISFDTSKVEVTDLTTFFMSLAKQKTA